ncbi:hypothetical protein L228DRAFT_237684 [Xylona heveae TC161]|uniref:Uncharacterized protein n=1 Tax=Xylona heveae (strain CBS 132557 / TC161) TaxID=1328760 RepID=A0A165IEU3_XYLHT|nr:hypothetical protein L228DRAFT_237684 [Xylona heveae TC161]KZF24794.1 hypothetical protein L228DRAFT_237684 [Xylona heveae TC161]
MPSNKPVLHALKTPVSATLPSELPRSPLPGISDLIKQEDGVKTPITPPIAYIDFLKALSPTVTSPATSEKFGDRFGDKSEKSTPVSQPSSAGSTCSCNCENHRSPNIVIPPSPFGRPHSAKTPTHLRRLRIPPSPLYSPGIESPLSASSIAFSARSPQEWDFEAKGRYFDAPRSASGRPVSVRQVVTRTITYTRTPLEPAPKGKRRKVE